MPTKPTQVETLLKLARQYGATELSADGVSFKLGPPPPTAGAKVAAATIGAPLCPCGHALYDHTALGCVHCGPDSRCVTKKGAARGA